MVDWQGYSICLRLVYSHIRVTFCILKWRICLVIVAIERVEYCPITILWSIIKPTISIFVIFICEDNRTSDYLPCLVCYYWNDKTTIPIITSPRVRDVDWIISLNWFVFSPTVNLIAVTESTYVVTCHTQCSTDIVSADRCCYFIIRVSHKLCRFFSCY